MKAVLLAAGRGTRLAPLTDSIPKILLPIDGRSLLEHQLNYLAQNGITDIAINVSHHAEQVLTELKRGEATLVRHVSREPRPHGTAAALLAFADFLIEPFIVLYGDVVTDTSLGELMAAHGRKGGIGTLTCYESSETAGKGLLDLDSDGRIVAFVEKPSEPSARGFVNAGVYALDPAVLELITPGRTDFGLDVWPAALAEGRRLYGHRIDDYVCDIGTPQALERIRRDVAAGVLAW